MRKLRWVQEYDYVRGRIGTPTTPVRRRYHLALCYIFNDDSGILFYFHMIGNEHKILVSTNIAKLLRNSLKGLLYIIRICERRSLFILGKIVSTLEKWLVIYRRVCQNISEYFQEYLKILSQDSRGMLLQTLKDPSSVFRPIKDMIFISNYSKRKIVNLLGYWP